MFGSLKCAPANQAAIELSKAKVCGFFCLAGVGACIKGMVKFGKEADLMVSIDGCPVQCAAKTLQHAEIETAIQIIITDLVSRSPMILPLTKRPAQWL